MRTTTPRHYRKVAAAAAVGALAVAVAPLASHAVEVDDEGTAARATGAHVEVPVVDAEATVSDAQAGEGQAGADTATVQVGEDVDVATPSAATSGGEDDAAVVDADAGIATARVLGARADVTDDRSAARAEVAHVTVPLLGELELWVLRSDAETSRGSAEASTTAVGLQLGEHTLLVLHSADGADGPRSELVRIDGPDGSQSIGEDGGSLCLLGDEAPARLICAGVSEASTVADLGVELDGTPVAGADLLSSSTADTSDAVAELPSTGPEVPRGDTAAAPGSTETARQAGGALPRTGAPLAAVAGLGALLAVAGLGLRRAAG